ncbi:MAG: hypothetical protein K2X68_13760 [Novosphingobium sp.]|nr:hypothetical protein [Novosphingobium sp.]
MALTACTTLSTGVLVSPPGVNKYSFRECLVTSGFFTPTPLRGLSYDNYVLRHAKDTRKYPPLADVYKMGDGPFIALSAKTIYGGLMPHQQFGGEQTDRPVAGNVADGSGGRPYVLNRSGGSYALLAEKSVQEVPDPISEPDQFDFALNRYLDCYIGPVGSESADAAPGLLAPNNGDVDLEGRLLRAHVLLAILAAYGTELVTSHASAKQPAYAALLLKDIANAEIELRISSQLVNNEALVTSGLASPISPDKKLTCAADRFAADQKALRWQSYATRILRVFQVAKDTQVIDAGQSLNRLTNIIAAFSRPSTLLFQGLLKDALGGFGAMQKVRLYGDAMLRDGRETLTGHRLATSLKGSDFTLSETDVAIRRWRLWDGNLRQSCAVLAAIAKDPSPACVPSDSALKEELARRVALLTGKDS